MDTAHVAAASGTFLYECPDGTAQVPSTFGSIKDSQAIPPNSADIAVAWYSGFPFRLKSNLRRHRDWVRWLSEWKIVHRVVRSVVASKVVLPLLAAWEIALLAWHDPAGMNDVEDDERDQHR